MLTVLHELPDGFLDASAGGLHQILSGPALIHLPGLRTPALFVSVLLHGNEDTGVRAIQSVLGRHAPGALPRAVSLFVGNVRAAALGVRRLDDQPDYNRIWSGAPDADLPEHTLALEVLQAMRERGVFASVDIHNNTGLNPHYACVSRIDNAFLQLATLFSRIVVHFRQPLGTQASAFAWLCPAVTLECGKPGNIGSEQHAADFVDALLHLDHLPTHKVAKHDLDLYESVGLVRVAEGIEFGFGDEDVPLSFQVDLDHLNFRDLPAGTCLARVAPGVAQPLTVVAPDGTEAGAHYFEVRAGRLLTRRPLMAAMLTLNRHVIRQDCLCYLMQRTDPDAML
jgi:succinylglutamate desuccinylase